ncbi:MAG: regulatory protein RecX [Candidatus Omnitrophica bacterium]|nr:regulatory protein RecX [Candidatus Omnitrophota bacterium]
MKTAADDGERSRTMLQAKSEALKLLAVRPRSVRELEERLRRKKHAQAVILQVVEELKRQGLLDDEKFAKLYAHSRIYTKPVSKKKIEEDLKRKGVSGDIAQKTLVSFGEDEKARARELILRRFEKMTGISDEKKKMRLYGFLKRRGFGSEVIFGVLGELFQGVEAFE